MVLYMKTPPIVLLGGVVLDFRADFRADSINSCKLLEWALKYLLYFALLPQKGD
jgi:hypothetical protein